MFTKVDKIKEALPHGSGINYQWDVEDKRKYYGAYNSFDVLNEYGAEIGVADFQLIIPKREPMEFRLHFKGQRSGYLAYYYGLRMFLEDIFADSIRDMMKQGIL